MFNQGSPFNFSEPLSMRVLPSFRNTYKKAYGINSGYQFSPYGRPHGGSSSESFNLMFNALTTSATNPMQIRVQFSLAILNSLEIYRFPTLDSRALPPSTGIFKEAATSKTRKIAT